MLLRLVQLRNALSPIDVTLLGIVMLVRLAQLSNALFPIEVTLSGIVMLLRLRQLLNVLSPIEVTLSGIVMPVRPVQFWNAPSAIKVTDAPENVLGRNTFPDEDLPSIKYAVFPEALIRYFMGLLSSEKEIPELKKTPLPIDVTLSGMLTLVRLEHPSKALNTIEVTLSGIVMLVSVVQSLNA